MNGKIYDQYRSAFSNVSGYAVFHNGNYIAKINFKYGSSRVWAYVHWHGEPMVRGFADGHGYDMASAAVAHAAEKLKISQGVWPDGTPHYSDETLAMFQQFRDAIAVDNGNIWQINLKISGFIVHCVV